MNTLESIGVRSQDWLDGFGGFCRFSGRTLYQALPAMRSRQVLRETARQFYEIGTRSTWVIMVTGVFVGAVLAVQAFPQFKAMGMVNRMGTIVNLSVLRELGPVLAGIMLAGRVGGGLTAELGTMCVTEQISALRAMGADPIRILVVPRFLACLLLIPVLAMYASFMGILGGFVTSVYLFGANPAEFWTTAAETVGAVDIFYGPIKCLFFGASTALICCWRGFSCRAGAAGVGQACTQAFVAACMTIITLDFFLGMTMNTLIGLIWGVQPKLI